jgi:hypothetical protein
MSTPITTEEVHWNRAQNHYSRWHQKNALPGELNGTLACQRLREPLFVPAILPGFKMQREDKVFAIGSCFARGIECALVEQKMAVLSRATEFDSFPAINNEMKLGFTNKYSTFSIYNELRWALDPAEEFPRESLVDIGNGVFYDPHTNPALQLAGLEETIRRREIIEAVTRRVAQCRVVIVTLGLVEVWRDKIANVFVNTAPIPPALHRHPDRYEFHITNFTENFSNLEHIHTLLSRFGHPDVQVVVTVSPVPLEATFSSEDVVIANTYSKSILRAAAQEWAATHKTCTISQATRSCKLGPEGDLGRRLAAEGEVVYHIMNLFSPLFRGPPAAELTASPNPVPPGARRGKTTISWSSDSASAVVYVSMNGAEEKFFARGSHGSEEAHWIQTGATYEFSLYSGPDRNTRLARISVTRPRNDKSDTLRTASRSKKYVSLVK